MEDPKAIARGMEPVDRFIRDHSTAENTPETAHNREAARQLEERTEGRSVPHPQRVNIHE